MGDAQGHSQGGVIPPPPPPPGDPRGGHGGHGVDPRQMDARRQNQAMQGPMNPQMNQPMGMNQGRSMNPPMNGFNPQMNQMNPGMMSHLGNQMNSSMNNPMGLGMNSQLGQLVTANQQKAMAPYTMSTVMDLRDEVGYPDSINSHHYEAWSLRRAAPEPGHQATWAKIKVAKLPISATEILASYSKHLKVAGTGIVTRTYKTLRSDKMRTGIDRAVQERNLSEYDRHYEWVLVHLDVTRRPIRSGVWGPTAAETTQIDLILKKSLKPEAIAAMSMTSMGMQSMNGGNGVQSLSNMQNMANMQNMQNMAAMHNQRMNQPTGVHFGQHQNGMSMGMNNNHPGNGMGGHGNMPGSMQGGMGGGAFKNNQNYPQPVQPINQVFNLDNRSGGKEDKKSKGERSRSDSPRRDRSNKYFDRESSSVRGRRGHDSQSESSSDTDNIEYKEFKRKIARQHGKDSDVYRQVESTRRSKSRGGDRSASRRRSRTPGPRRRNSSRSRRTGSDTDDSWQEIGYDDRSDSGRHSDAYDEEYIRSRRGKSRRRSMGGDSYRHSSSSLSRPPSLRRARTPGRDRDSIVRHVHEYRIPADEDEFRHRSLPVRTLSYPNGGRGALPPVPHVSDLTSRRMDDAQRYQDERRAYIAGRRDAETEYGGSWDGESVSDYERRLERKVRTQRDRLGRRASGIDDWNTMGRRSDWP